MKATTFICDHKMYVDILVEDLALMAGDIRGSGHDGVGMTAGVSRPLLQGDKDNNRMHSYSACHCTAGKPHFPVHFEHSNALVLPSCLFAGRANFVN
jgi:hypothetical protein